MRRRGEDSTTFLDFLFLMVLVMLLLVNPKVPATKSDVPPPGNLVVTIVWPEGATDVDLWLVGPNEPRAVGYSNREGKDWSLLRDDLGTANDSLPVNSESAYSRAVPAGRYVVNLHCYRCHTGPVPVSVEVRTANMTGGVSRLLATTTVTLARHGQEVTAIAFDLDGTGAIVPGSASNVFTPLRAARS